MLSRLFFVVALLISGIPIFSITQIFGGVAISAIVQSFGIAAATAFITGAVAMAIAVFKVGTRRTIFSFYMFIVVYLVGRFMLDQIDYFHVSTLANGSSKLKTSWWTGLNPVAGPADDLSMKRPTRPPTLAQLPQGLQAWPIGWYLSNPASFYTSLMFFLSFVLVSPSMLVLRRLAQSTTSLRRWILQKLRTQHRRHATASPARSGATRLPGAKPRPRPRPPGRRCCAMGSSLLGVGGALVLVLAIRQHSAPPPYRRLHRRQFLQCRPSATVADRLSRPMVRFDQPIADDFANPVHRHAGDQRYAGRECRS